MPSNTPARSVLIWAGLSLAIAVPILIAARSPLLAWRDPIYIFAGLAGVIGLTLLLVQPLLAGRLLPGLSPRQSRLLHRGAGLSLLAAVILHVAGLWITSPPDVVDALLFTSATPFSAWGVIAMWAIFATTCLAIFRSRLRFRPATWRRIHTGIALVIVTGTIVHAMLIEGTMGTVSKALLCLLVAGATVRTIVRLKVWKT